MLLLDNGVIHFFALLDTYVCGELRHKFLGIEYIVAEHGEEGHDDCSLSGFLGLDGVFHTLYPLRELPQLINEIHSPHSSFFFLADLNTLNFPRKGISLESYGVLGSSSAFSFWSCTHLYSTKAMTSS